VEDRDALLFVGVWDVHAAPGGFFRATPYRGSSTT
jgi:hypothetical protein